MQNLKQDNNNLKSPIKSANSYYKFNYNENN
jgi:hypothetical protein